MRSKDIGELAEAEFICASMRRGLIISEPRGDNQKYDFIVDSGTRLLKVQVKATSSYSKNKDFYQVGTSYGSDSKKLYTSNDIDFFACYIVPKECWYIIPVTSVHTPSIRLYDSSGVSKFSPYKEAWRFLIT